MPHPVHTLEQTGDTQAERSGNRGYFGYQHDGSEINTDDLDPKKYYPKPKPVEQLEEIEINGKGQIT